MSQELCESGGGRPGFPVPHSPNGLCGRKAALKSKCLRSCVKVEVAVLGSIVRTVSVDVKQHWTRTLGPFRAQEVCESRGGRSGLPGPNSPYGLCGRKATLNLV